MMPPYETLAVANCILETAQKQGKQLNIVQLLNFVYLAHGLWLSRTGSPLTKTAPQAWQNGPVYPEVLRAFRRYSNSTIWLKAINEITGYPYAASFSSEVIEHLEGVVRFYADRRAGSQLEMMSRPGTPSFITLHETGEYSAIPNKLIQAQFDELRQQQAKPDSGIAQVQSATKANTQAAPNLDEAAKLHAQMEEFQFSVREFREAGKLRAKLCEYIEDRRHESRAILKYRSWFTLLVSAMILSMWGLLLYFYIEPPNWFASIGVVYPVLLTLALIGGAVYLTNILHRGLFYGVRSDVHTDDFLPEHIKELIQGVKVLGVKKDSSDTKQPVEK